MEGERKKILGGEERIPNYGTVTKTSVSLVTSTGMKVNFLEPINCVQCTTLLKLLLAHKCAVDYVKFLAEDPGFCEARAAFKKYLIDIKNFGSHLTSEESVELTKHGKNVSAKLYECGMEYRAARHEAEQKFQVVRDYSSMAKHEGGGDNCRKESFQRFIW